MLPIEHLSHITLICKDIEKSGNFLHKIFGAVEQYATKKTIFSLSKERFFKIGNLWLVIMEGEPVTPTYNHIAFKVDAARLPLLKIEIEKLGLKILEGRERKAEEGDSLYFYDYDNHLFELHAGDLEARLKFYCDYEKRSDKGG